ncbi:uncharacterized protein L3040_002382 [Drepanopeziza brunnea f. sp. 'multigermtubi']|uniref:uncharacterized protein n=1 Tax=Drepanopeziza brunnea f. sp. 'multigermtubi' TaxID=698441 RepID=UPI002385292A|nr:hypothetical protein L3040_002382 [Drepanopeziza brunnea f. sp. 'multigermtubi']
MARLLHDVAAPALLLLMLMTPCIIMVSIATIIVNTTTWKPPFAISTPTSIAASTILTTHFQTDNTLMDNISVPDQSNSLKSATGLADSPSVATAGGGNTRASDIDLKTERSTTSDVHIIRRRRRRALAHRP